MNEATASRLASLRAFSSRENYTTKYGLSRLHQAVIEGVPIELESLQRLPHSIIDEEDVHGHTALFGQHFAEITTTFLSC